MNPSEYLEINRKNWNNRVDAHLNSNFYFMEDFRKGKSSLNSIELNLLGEITNKSILHLQCHFGQDSISLARMGAKVTAVDLSDKAIETGRKLAEELNTPVHFICSDIYDAPNHISEKFDVVFTSYGTIGWLPDMGKWAEVISKMLKPGGKFIFVEFHPVVWMFDDHFQTIGYNYFNSGPLVETEVGTYADREADLHQSCINWNHSLSEVINNLIQNGIKIEQLAEYDYSPYNCFLHTEEFEPGKFRIQHLGNKIPMVYSVVGEKCAAN